MTRHHRGGALLASAALLSWMAAVAVLPASAAKQQCRVDRHPPVGVMVATRSGHTATLLGDGRVLVVGGWAHDRHRCAPEAELFDPATGTFSAVGAMVATRAGDILGRQGHTATLLGDGRVLIVGGYWDPVLGLFPAPVLFDPATGRSRAIKGSRPPGDASFVQYYAEAGFTATLLGDGRVLIAGGSSDMSDGPVDTAELYDPATRRLSLAGPITTPRSGHTATLVGDGRVLLAGGYDTEWGEGLTDDEKVGLRPPDSAELYDPATGTFTPTGPMGTYGHTATLLGDGRVLITGAADEKTLDDVDSAELYDPATGTFTPTGPMATSGHTATLLGDGRVLIVGGYDEGTDDDVDSAELYDPATGTFSPTGSMPIAREGHTATLLGDGRVLIAGGGGKSASAELYDPATGTFIPVQRSSAVPGAAPSPTTGRSSQSPGLQSGVPRRDRDRPR